ncbi:GAF and ANTAR domain-containing protein [Nocardia pseudobrasiliensis]|uniref:GAF domain-containing protein n=1 Tax=Nocardia pseudobrasiliensis TaxID=45979 RepID=A0A370HZW1_9NOCA|nr:GAF and ANTAR domain-containing protein [Nocardia pseudobrasiliensis]RDI63481.1 GAF domain-containing protein [Nocardia pseudobrasiliensis]
MSKDGSRPDELAVGFAQLTAVVLPTCDVENSLRDIAVITSRMLTGRPTVGVTLDRGAATVTVTSADAHTMLSGEIERTARLGPGGETLLTARSVTVRDVRTERRWGEYPARMLAHGVRSIHFEPLLTGDDPIGALSLYSESADGFDTHARETIALAGLHTGMLLSAALHTAHQTELTVQLQSALASRSVIDQALGMVMAQRRCGRDHAFSVLSTISQHRNVKLVDIAVEVIRAVTGSPPAPTHFDPPGPHDPAARGFRPGA